MEAPRKGAEVERTLNEALHDDPSARAKKRASKQVAKSAAKRDATPAGKATAKPAAKVAASSGEDATAVTRSVPARTGKAGRAGETTVAGVRITHPDRVIDKSTGTRKIDLVRYYESVADWMLPHLKDRPVSLVRAPEDIGGELFFQKHSQKLSIPNVTQHPGLDPDHPPLITIESVQALVGAAQMGTIELHTWNAVASSIEKPDRIVFDLDPDPSLGWGRMIEAAQLTRSLLEELGLTSFCKTSGGKGFHVVVPLAKQAGWDEVKAFSQAVAQHMATALPTHFAAKMGAQNRKKKIFIDYLRNNRGSSTVAAYSARARPGLGVSVPLSWDEVPGTTGGAPDGRPAFTEEHDENFTAAIDNGTGAGNGEKARTRFVDGTRPSTHRRHRAAAARVRPGPQRASRRGSASRRQAGASRRRAQARRHRPPGRRRLSAAHAERCADECEFGVEAGFGFRWRGASQTLARRRFTAGAACRKATVSARLPIPVRRIAEMAGEKIDKRDRLRRHERAARIHRPDRDGFGERIAVEHRHELAAAQMAGDVPRRLQRNAETVKQRIADHLAVIGGEQQITRRFTASRRATSDESFNAPSRIATSIPASTRSTR